MQQVVTAIDQLQKMPPGIEIQPLKVEIAKLTLEAGDILAVIFKEHITMAQAEEVRDNLKRAVPSKIDVIIFAEDVELAVLKPIPELEYGSEYTLVEERADADSD